jgi:hypothetical protein
MENKNVVQPEKECQSCKNKQTPNMILKNNWWVFVASFYILFSSVYGTIQFVKGLISLFN